MKPLIITILLLTTFNLSGQNSTKETPSSDPKRILIGISVSPDICYRTLRNNDGSSSSDLIIDLRNQQEIYKIGSTAGLIASYSFTDFFSLETGLQYSNKGFRTKEQDVIIVEPEEDLPQKTRFIYNFHYIDIPVKANFVIGKKNVRFVTSVGLTTNFLLKETQTSILIYQDHTDRNTDLTNYTHKKVNISPTISAGIDYKLNSRMNLRIMPVFRYGILKIIDAPVTGYLYSGGLNISYYFIL